MRFASGTGSSAAADAGFVPSAEQLITHTSRNAVLSRLFIDFEMVQVDVAAERGTPSKPMRVQLENQLEWKMQKTCRRPFRERREMFPKNLLESRDRLLRRRRRPHGR